MPPACLSIPRASCPVVREGGSWEGTGAAWASARPPPFLGGCGGFSEEGRATLLGGGWTLVGRGGGTGQSLGQASMGGSPGPLTSACPLQPRLRCLCTVCRACPRPRPRPRPAVLLAPCRRFCLSHLWGLRVDLVDGSQACCSVSCYIPDGPQTTENSPPTIPGG